MKLHVVSIALCAAVARAGALSLLLNGQPAAVGNYTINEATVLVADNGLIEFSFGHRQGGGFQLLRALVNGTQIDDSREASWYVDWSGGKGPDGAKWSVLRIIRADELVHFSFVDTTNDLIRNELHNLMTADTRGMYGFNVLTTQKPESLNEVRFNTRWDRCTLNHAYSRERGVGQQPTYAYLDTQFKVQDETWRIDGVNNASLPCPNDNAGNLPAGTVYTKYDWVLYASNNPLWGHWGISTDNNALIGMWFTALGGVTNATAAASYAVGAQHQDLALHQDGLILNYMNANHFGLPAYNVKAGYTRLYGPWLLHASVTPAALGVDALIADGEATAQANIDASLYGLPFISHPLYPLADSRVAVAGNVVIADGRPAGGLWALLCVERVDDLYTLRENTYYVATTNDGAFALPGIPVGTYSLYVFSSRGGSSIVGFLRVDGVAVSDDGSGTFSLGEVAWTPSDAGRTHLWQIGAADREGGEFALGTSQRDWYLPGRVPGDVTFTIGSSREDTHWYYAQTQPGVWTVSFELPTTYTGTAYLTVGASMTQQDSPSVAVNGHPIDGAAPSGSDSTLSRQAIRSGYYRSVESKFDAALLVAGTNTVTFTRAAARGSNKTGMGWDTVLLAVDGQGLGGGVRGVAASPKAALRVSGGVLSANGAHVVVSIVNDGDAPAMDVRAAACLAGAGPYHAAASTPVAAFILSRGGVASVKFPSAEVPVEAGGVVCVTVTADGGRTRVAADVTLRV